MDFSEQGQNPAKKMTGIAFVILFHVLVVYALMTGLARKVVEVIKLPVETKLIEEITPPPPKDIPPPPPPPKMVAPPPPFIPPPEVAVQQPVQNTITAVTNVTPPTNVMPAPQRETAPAPVAVASTPAVVDFSTCSKPEYPRNSLRNEEQGTVVLQFTIGADGHVVDSTVGKSSGFKDLDKAARNALSQCRFKPAIIDGKPAQSSTKVEYVWKLD